MKALSVRAWLIVNGYKDVENRVSDTKLRGRIWIHTGVHRITRAEYEEFVKNRQAFGIRKFSKIDEFENGDSLGGLRLSIA